MAAQEPVHPDPACAPRRSARDLGSAVSVAVEALRDARAKRCFNMDDLGDMARVCRIHNVIRPYLEALT